MPVSDSPKLQSSRGNFVLELKAEGAVDGTRELDLCFSIDGHQPARSPSGRFAVIGDVCLFNRDNLPDLSSSSDSSDLSAFSGSSGSPFKDDRELVAALWESMGETLPPLLTGIFAFVVLDLHNHCQFLVRDQVGARTIYYSTADGIHRISSALPSLAKRLSRRSIDPVALRDYLSCAFVPGSRTMLSEISEVRPGTIVALPSGRQTTYWQVQERLAEVTPSLHECASNLRNILSLVIEEYLPKAEPVGAYLSGGIDSSLVAAFCKRLHDHEVHTFSIHFGEELPNELIFSRMLAEHAETDHHVVEISSSQMWDLLPECMSHLDDPIGDPLTIPNLILGRTASQFTGTILNGEGGDPCFGGPKNQPMLLDNLYGGSEAYATGLSEGDRLVSAYLASFQKCANDLTRLLQPHIARSCLKERSVFEDDLLSDCRFLNRLMFINTKFKGADHILTKVNNLTRATGLLGLSPLFDARVVDFSLTVPPHFKLQGAEEKAVLKAAVHDLVPEAILTRPKSGMMVPVQYWFRERWHRQTQSLLLSRESRILSVTNRDLIKQWVNYEGDTWGRYGVKLWLLVSLECWLRNHL